MVIYTGKRGEGSKKVPVQYLSPHPSLKTLGSAGLCSAESFFTSSAFLLCLYSAHILLFNG